MTATQKINATQKITLLILARIAAGATAAEALDAVCGDGTYAKLAGDVWEALQK